MDKSEFKHKENSPESKRFLVFSEKTSRIAVPALGYWLFGLNEIIAFWFAYIVTRPLGASFADWMGRPSNLGGLGLGTGQISLGLAILIVCFVGYLTINRLDTKQ